MQYVEWDKVNETGEELISYSENEILNQIKLINDLKKQATWEGADADTSMQGFTQFMTDMEKLSEAIKRYGQFLTGVAAKYKSTSNSIKNIFENEIYRG